MKSLNTARITPFPHTPYSQRTENENSVSDLVSTKYYSHARGKEEIDLEETIDSLAEYYMAALGTQAMPPVARQRCRICHRDGMDLKLVQIALDEASMAPRPSWAYANAILMRLQQEGIKTVEEYYDRQDRWQNRFRR